jgi:nicotinamide-nucleotide amidase
MSQLKELLLRPPRLTLAVAESLTSGRIQARIGAISGASHFFLGGITAYNLDQKVRHLGVDRESAKASNCVSAEVATQMARGACTFFGSDLALATTGYAEPSVEWNVPQPFAWYALAHRRGQGNAPDDFFIQTACIDCPNLERIAVQERVAEAALNALIKYLDERQRVDSPKLKQGDFVPPSE